MSTRIPFILLSTSDGSPITGATPSVTISKDGGSFTAATNSPAEIGNGYYYVDLTTAETTVTNNVIIRATATGAQPTAVVWEPEQAMPTVPTAADNATAVWGAQTKEITGAVTINATQASTLATAAALTTVGDNVAAVKAKTDNLPATPAATGDAMTLTSAYDAAKTASQFNAATDAVTIGEASEQAIRSGLSTFNPATDAVTIDSVQASTFATATAQAAQTAALETLAASILHWAATASTLTLYDNNGAAIGVYDLTRDSSGNITAIEPHAEGNG